MSLTSLYLKRLGELLEHLGFCSLSSGSKEYKIWASYYQNSTTIVWLVNSEQLGPEESGFHRIITPSAGKIRNIINSWRL